VVGRCSRRSAANIEMEGTDHASRAQHHHSPKSWKQRSPFYTSNDQHIDVLSALSAQNKYESGHAHPRKTPTMQDSSQPSTANIAVACAIVAGVTGYMFGQAKSLGLFGGSRVSKTSETKEKDSDALEEKDSEESSDEESDEDSGEDNTVPAEFPGHNEECKMVLVVRTDLGMTKGTHCIITGIYNAAY
jgi:hypothetical protein